MIRSLFVFALAFYSYSTNAIVMRHDVDEIHYRELSNSFGGVVTFGNRLGSVAGMGTLIHEDWVLTAAHVARQRTVGEVIAIGKHTATIKSITIHPQWKWEAKLFVYDIALVEIENLSGSVPTASLYSGTDELGKKLTFIGRGDSGYGNDGSFKADGVLRAANNIVSEADEFRIKFLFDPPETALPLEGISGPGDSGGPALLFDNGGIFIVGVSSTQNTKGSNGVEGVYGVVENYIRVSAFKPWILSVING